jgi:uncharacterized membrane protein required for colicin V production
MFIYLTLRILVTALVVVAVTSVFQFAAGLAREPFREGPLGFLDRVGGIATGAATGLILAALLMLGLVFTPWPSRSERAVAKARFTAPLFEGSERLCRFGEGRVLGATWLRRQFASAARRASS